jgi:hypothetical protein
MLGDGMDRARLLDCLAADSARLRDIAGRDLSARDLAVDGLDELMTDFLAEVTRLFPEEFTAELTDWADRWVLVSAGDTAWRVTVRPDGAKVTRLDPPGSDEDGAAASVRAEPGALMRWLYNRGGTDLVATDGDAELIAQLGRLLTAVTNTT